MTATPTMTAPAAPAPIRWFFNWKGGGYNSVIAATRDEALRLAQARAGGTTLKVDEATLRPDPDGALTSAADLDHAGLFF